MCRHRNASIPEITKDEDVISPQVWSLDPPVCVQASQDPEASLRAALYTALAPLQEDVQDALDDEAMLGPDLLQRVWSSPRIACLVWQLCYCPLAGPAWELLAGETLSDLPLRRDSSAAGAGQQHRICLSALRGSQKLHCSWQAHHIRCMAAVQVQRLWVQQGHACTVRHGLEWF